jgi:hypothetical protein
MLEDNRGAELDRGWLGTRKLFDGADVCDCVGSVCVTRFPGGEEIGLGRGLGADDPLDADWGAVGIGGSFLCAVEGVGEGVLREGVGTGFTAFVAGIDNGGLAPCVGSGERVEVIEA